MKSSGQTSYGLTRFNRLDPGMSGAAQQAPTVPQIANTTHCKRVQDFPLIGLSHLKRRCSGRGEKRAPLARDLAPSRRCPTKKGYRESKAEKGGTTLDADGGSILESH